MDSLSFANDVVFGDAWLIIDAQGNLKVAAQGYIPQDGDVIVSVGSTPLTIPEDIVSELRVSIAQQGNVQSVDAQGGIRGVVDSLNRDNQSSAEEELESEDDDGSSLTTTGAVSRDGAQTIATTDFQTEGVFPSSFTFDQADAFADFIEQIVIVLSQGSVSISDNNGEEVINGEGETASINGVIAGGANSLDSLIILDSNQQQLVIDVSLITVGENGQYSVEGIDVSTLSDGELTVTAISTDGNGNSIEVNDVVEKDFTYGEDINGDGVTPARVSLTDNNGEEVINGEGETAVITGSLGEGGEELTSLIITDVDGKELIIPSADIQFDGNGNYTVININVDDLADGILTVTANSTDMDGNTASVTDTVEKDYTYGDDSDDDGSDITPPSVSLTDNNGEEVINGEGETAVITAYLGEGGEELTSLIITDVDGKELIIPSADIQFDGNGNYTVININVDDLADGILTVTANSTDVDGNTASISDTVEKDYTYGDDSDDDGSDITPPSVSLTDNNGEEVINGEGETATISGYLGEGGKTLDSLIITDINNQQLLIAKEYIAIDENGHYTVTGINVDDLADGTLTVTANSTDVDGNTATATDTVEKDYTYGDDSDDDGADITPPSVSLTDNSGEEVINGEGETATITGYLGEGGKTLDSLIITDINNQQLLITKEDIAIDENGHYTVTEINVDDLADGTLTVTANSTDVDGNTISVTDTVEKDYTYGDDSDDDGSDITPPSVSLTDNNGEEVINGEGETATITGYLGEGGKTLDSLIITDINNQQLLIEKEDIAIDENGNYTVTGINVDGLADGTLTVTANSTDVDGNTTSVTDTVEKDYTYGDDSDDDGSDITPPSVSLTDNNGEEVINGEGETATISGYLGEGGKTLDSLIITDINNQQLLIAKEDIAIDENGNYTVTGINVDDLADGTLTVTASSTDVDGNTASITDTVEKDYTYGDDSDDDGSDITPPSVYLTDNNGEEVIDGETETATVTGYLGEGGLALESLIITDSSQNQIVVHASKISINDAGYYTATGIDVGGLDEGVLTVTAKSIDIDGNKTSATDTAVMTINDAPTANSGLVSGQEDTAIVFQWADFGANDVDTTQDSLSIVLKSLPIDGVLQMNTDGGWSDVSVGDLISSAKIVADGLRFVPDENASGDDNFDVSGLGNQKSDYASFSFAVSDGDKESTIESMSIDIAAVADRPNLLVENDKTEASIDFQDTELGKRNWSSNIDISDVFGEHTLGTWYANDDNKVEIGKESVYRKGASKANLVMEIEGDSGDNSIFTDIQVTEGRYYSFTFDVAARRWANGDSDLDVIWVKLDDQGQPILDQALTLYEFRPTDNSWERDIQLSLPSDSEGNYRLLLQSTDANSYGALIDNLVLESSDAFGEVDTFVELWDISANLNDTDGSEILTVELSGLLEGTTIKDDLGNSYLVGSDGKADVSGFDLSSLKANVPEAGHYSIEVTATATETSNGDSVSKSITLPLVIYSAEVSIPEDGDNSDNEGLGAWGLTPKNGLSVTEGQISGPIAIKLLEGGTVRLASGASLTFTFALVGFSEGLTAQDFELNLNTSSDYSSSSVVNSDGEIEVTVQNISGAEIVVGRGNSDDGLLSIEVAATADSQIEDEETFTLHLVEASIGSPKEQQDEIDVTIIDGPMMAQNRLFTDTANEIMAGLGDDILQGTSEQDNFIWKSEILDNSTDLIQDFSVGEDGIVLNDILEPTQSDSIDELLNKIEVNVVGDDVTLGIDHEGGTQTIVIQDARDQFGDSIANNGSFDAAEILNQLIVKANDM
ncbi:cadherin-like domain-containing protein [Vibrio neonatus]|uniref:cadherin-like domain-containing protein n=1 Tax=Vibrio neonatus TaxID=278860 RepID=UPI0021C33403|nr:cadherin-like domain-containing protein [Vibrio neonatus]